LKQLFHEKAAEAGVFGDETRIREGKDLKDGTAEEQGSKERKDLADRQGSF
jgi:hypothetical protein